MKQKSQMVKILYYYHKKIKILHFFHQNLKILYCCHQNINQFAKKIPEAHSEPTRTYKMELFAKIVTTFQRLTIFGKSSILDIWLGFEYTSESRYKNNFSTFSLIIKRLIKTTETVIECVLFSCEFCEISQNTFFT